MSCPDKDPPAWELVDRQSVVTSPIFSVDRHRARSALSGNEHDFYIFHCDDWVNVIPITEAGDVLMIRQYRHGTKQVTLEIPGGLMDPGDASPQAAAERELGEETGYSAQQWHYLGKIAPNPAMQSNLCHSFLALNARETAVQNLDHAEEIRVVCVPRGEIEARIRAGEISHALVVVAFYYLSLFERDH